MSVAYRCLKGGGIFWEGGVDYLSVAYSGSERVIYSGWMGRLWESRNLRGGVYSRWAGRLWEGRIDSGSVTYSCEKRGYILEGRGRL